MPYSAYKMSPSSTSNSIASPKAVPLGRRTSLTTFDITAWSHETAQLQVPTTNFYSGTPPPLSTEQCQELDKEAPQDYESVSISIAKASPLLYQPTSPPYQPKSPITDKDIDDIYEPE